MSYSIYDFSETLAGTGIKKEEVKKVTAAWGETGAYAEWEGGFLLHMKDGRWCYLSGWCDTTGWGCQDGTNIKWFEQKPELDSLKSKLDWCDRAVEWETEPADCKKYLAGEIDEFAR